MLADISINVVLEMFFLILNNTKINFIDYKFNQRFYTMINALPTTKWVELVEKKELVVAAFNLDNKTLQFIQHLLSAST